MPMMKQPVLGVTATALTIALSLAFTSLFPFPVFASWVAYLAMCLIPMQIVIGVVWEARWPAVAARQPQPAKGLALTALTVLAAAVVAPTYLLLTGGGFAAPGPVPSHAIIVSVVTTFWFCIVWGGWPFTASIRSPVAAGVTLMVAAYAINLLLFNLLFDYSFMQGSPAYPAAQDPRGLFNAIHVLVVYVTALSVMFVLLNFELWPLTRFPGLLRQPWLGLVWTAICLGLGGLIFWVGVRWLGMEPMIFLVRVSIPFIFGSIVILNMLQNTLTARLAQPIRGLANTVLAAIIGTALAGLYRLLAPLVSGPLSSGPPGFDAEVWLASAMLGITFPLLTYFSGFFQYWPLSRSETPQADVRIGLHDGSSHN